MHHYIYIYIYMCVCVCACMRRSSVLLQMHAHAFTQIHIYVCMCMYVCMCDICCCIPPDRTRHKVNDSKADYSGDLEEAKVGHKPNSNPGKLCCSSTHLVQCGPDEPSWSWTQIWVQARTPAYSLNWTARSSAVQGGQRCQYCCLSTRRGPSRSWGPFGLESAIDFECVCVCVCVKISLSFRDTNMSIFEAVWLTC